MDSNRFAISDSDALTRSITAWYQLARILRWHQRFLLIANTQCSPSQRVPIGSFPYTFGVGVFSAHYINAGDRKRVALLMALCDVTILGCQDS